MTTTNEPGNIVPGYKRIQSVKQGYGNQLQQKLA